MGDRDSQIGSFLDTAGWSQSVRSMLAGDASFRKYWRLVRDSETAVLMDAPPPQENVEAFHRIADLLLGIGLSAPRPRAVDPHAGLMLLEDLGDRTFTKALANGADEALLYGLAVDVLIALHQRCSPALLEAANLPPYDDARLLDEAALLTDWFLPALRGASTPSGIRDAYTQAWLEVFPVARRLPDTLVLRDFHVDNLMIIEGREGITAVGLLDFQDAVIGPVAYDLVSLLEDARRDVDPALAEAMAQRYAAAFPDLDKAALDAGMAVLGAQRSAKIIGIFTRLDRRDGKPQYLQHVPRVWRLLERDLAHPALEPVRSWFDREIRAQERVAPPQGTAA